MAKYLIKGRYGPEGLAGLLAGGASARRAVIEKSAAELGGSIEAMYYAFGDDDVYVICELPDNHAAAKFSMVASKSGRVRTTVVPLLGVEDVDAIAAGPEPSYVPPGG